MEPELTPRLDREIPGWAYSPMMPESCGTTLVAVEYKDGVVLGADSRTSMGNFVSCRVSDKLTPVTDMIYACRSGSSADTQTITDIVKYRLDILQNVENKTPTVYRAAQIFRQYCYDYRDSLSASVLVCGYDDVKGGQVYAIPIGGFTTRQRTAASGSGSTYVMGYLDSQWQPDMTQEQAEKFVLNAVRLAMHRDGSSGGVCRLGVLNSNGMTRKLFTIDGKAKLPQVQVPAAYPAYEVL